MRGACLVFLIIVLLLAPVYLRTLIEANRELVLARASADQAEALEHYRRAILWRAPLNDSSYRALAELKDFALKIADPALKLDTLRELRSAYLGSRSLLDSLPALSATEREAREIISKVDDLIFSAIPTEQRDRPYVRHAHVYEEKPWIYLLAQITFWSWIISMFRLIWCGFSPQGKFVYDKARAPMFGATCFYLLWIFVLTQG